MGNFAYFPHTEDDIRVMLERIGVRSLDDLYSDVPADFVYNKEYDLPDALSEQEVRDFFEELGKKNTPLKVFAGQGAYDHYVPSVIPYITSRSEFLTAYTPYQCEISQGTLRYIFEWQSMICRLTGMDVSNASMYDGPSAAAEALRMAVSCTRKRNKVVVSTKLMQNVLDVVKSYLKYPDIEVVYAWDVLEALGPDVAGVIVPSICRHGIIQDLSGIADAVHAVGALLIEYCDPSALAVLKTPAEWGADIAVGDGQSLGIPLCYGGPYVGFLACKSEYMRKLPGRIVGQASDKDGKRCFVLTLQAREQHIRREKASSNICSNEALCALTAGLYMATMGPDGMAEVANQCMAKAHYLANELCKLDGVKLRYEGAFFHEFLLDMPKCKEIEHALMKKGILSGLPYEDGMLWCVTEKVAKETLDEVVSVVKEVLA